YAAREKRQTRRENSITNSSTDLGRDRRRRGDVTAQDPHFPRTPPQLFERGPRFRGLRRRDQVEIETIFERLAHDRAALDFHQIDTLLRDRFKRPVQCTGL